MKDIGSCKCGAVNYAINGEIKAVVNCHCSMCRKINGAAVSTYVVISEEDFILTNGANELKHYIVTASASKYFCGKCGTPIYNSNPGKYKGLIILHLGTLNDHDKYIPQVNIYSDTKLSWLDTISAIKSYEQGR